MKRLKRATNSCLKGILIELIDDARDQMINIFNSYSGRRNHCLKLIPIVSTMANMNDTDSKGLFFFFDTMAESVFN